jgi:hypothetical protein
MGVLGKVSVSSISISKRATEKLLKDSDYRSKLRGVPLVPCLAYYQRSYSTLNDGRIIEHGPGLILSFIEQSEAGQYQYPTVDLGSGCTLLLAPSTFFQSGTHFIDLVDDQKFKLDTVVG